MTKEDRALGHQTVRLLLTCRGLLSHSSLFRADLPSLNPERWQYCSLHRPSQTRSHTSAFSEFDAKGGKGGGDDFAKMMSLCGSSGPGRAWPCAYSASPYSCRAQLQQSDCQPGLGKTKELRFCPHLGWRETKRTGARIVHWPKRNRLPGRTLGTTKMHTERKNKQTNKNGSCEPDSLGVSVGSDGWMLQKAEARRRATNRAFSMGTFVRQTEHVSQYGFFSACGSVL